MTGRIRDLGQKYESGSQKRKRREKKETKSKQVESSCKKISQFFPNVNEQLADPTSIQSLSYDSQNCTSLMFFVVDSWEVRATSTGSKVARSTTNSAAACSSSRNSAVQLCATIIVKP